ncbi:MAG: 30S ribosomal protein S8 [Lentisphaeria bacterium]|nr:30S ribosomal protein S8 [Lentisphaeria bacterium]
MSLHDPIADMLTRLRNAGSALLPRVEMQSSNERAAIAAVLKREGFIADYSVIEDGVKKILVVDLKIANRASAIEGITRVSKPSCRIYCGSKDVPKVRNGFGVVILSTPKGIISGKEAQAANVGGEVLCYVW